MLPECLVTSFSAEGAAQYGRRGVESWAHWPASMGRVAYVDAPMTLPVETRATASMVGWPATRDMLHAENPLGLKPTNYIWNARRFAVKPFVWYDAAVKLGEGALIWLDGDTRTLQAVPEGFAWTVLGGADVAFLGRGDMHPETGAVVFRLPEALPLIRWCRHTYVTGLYTRIADGWTDCHVLRAGLEKVPVRSRDLTSDLVSAWSSQWDAMALSPFGPYVHHYKGPRAKREAACVH